MQIEEDFDSLSQNSNQFIYESFEKHPTKKNNNQHSIVEDRQTSYCSDASSESLCPFCPKLFSVIDSWNMLNGALYSKYSSSQNFFYKKEMENFFAQKFQLKTEIRRKIIGFQDARLSHDTSEYLFGYFKCKQIPEKTSQLVEYYKFHNEIPRIFQKNVIKIIFKYHDKKRKIQFSKLSKLLLSDEKDNKQKNGMTKKYPSILKSIIYNDRQVAPQNNPQDSFSLFKNQQNDIPSCSNLSQLLLQQSYLNNNNNMMSTNLSYSVFFEKSLSDLLQVLNNSEKKICVKKNQINEKQILEKFQLIKSQQQQQQQQQQTEKNKKQSSLLKEAPKEEIKIKIQPQISKLQKDKQQFPKCLYTTCTTLSTAPSLTSKIETMQNKFPIKEAEHQRSRQPNNFTINTSTKQQMFFKPNYAQQIEHQRCQTFHTGTSSNQIQGDSTNIQNLKSSKQMQIKRTGKNKSASPFPKKLSIKCPREASEFQKYFEFQNNCFFQNLFFTENALKSFRQQVESTFIRDSKLLT